jgi:hypothetical protein
VEGRLSALTSSSLSIRTKEATPIVSFRSADVRRVHIRGPKPIGKGALIGLGVGAGVGLIAVAATDNQHGCFPATSCQQLAGISAAFFGGIGAGLGASAGAGADGKKLLVYEAPATSSSIHRGAWLIYERRLGSRSIGLRASPILDRRQQGLQIAVGF